MLLRSNLIRNQFNRTKLSRISLLVFLWIVGLAFGVKLVPSIPVDTTISYNIVSISPRWYPLVLITITPIALCIVAIRYDLFLLNCVIIVLESVCRGFCGFWIYLTCGTGSWLIRTLLLFSSTAGLFFLWWILIKSTLYNKSYNYKDFAIIASLMFLFIMVDILWISPFLIHLSIYF